VSAPISLAVKNFGHRTRRRTRNDHLRHNRDGNVLMRDLGLFQDHFICAVVIVAVVTYPLYVSRKLEPTVQQEQEQTGAVSSHDAEERRRRSRLANGFVGPTRRVVALPCSRTVVRTDKTGGWRYGQVRSARRIGQCGGVQAAL
jgi:hypothetical protein